MKSKLTVFTETLSIHLIIQFVFMAVMVSLFDAVDALNKTFYLGMIVSISIYFSVVRVLKSNKE